MKQHILQRIASDDINNHTDKNNSYNNNSNGGTNGLINGNNSFFVRSNGLENNKQLPLQDYITTYNQPYLAPFPIPRYDNYTSKYSNNSSYGTPTPYNITELGVSNITVAEQPVGNVGGNNNYTISEFNRQSSLSPEAIAVSNIMSTLGDTKVAKTKKRNSYSTEEKTSNNSDSIIHKRKPKIKLKKRQKKKRKITSTENNDNNIKFRFKCRRCGYSTNVKANIRIHLTRKHTCKADMEDVPVDVLYKEQLGETMPGSTDVKSAKIGSRAGNLQKKQKQTENNNNLQKKQKQTENNAILQKKQKEIENNDNVYVVEAILSRKYDRGQVHDNALRNRHYLIKWRGYDMSHNTWETAASLKADGLGLLVAVWEKNNKNNAKPYQHIPVGFLTGKNGKPTDTIGVLSKKKMKKASDELVKANKEKRRQKRQAALLKRQAELLKKCRESRTSDNPQPAEKNVLESVVPPSVTASKTDSNIEQVNSSNVDDNPLPSNAASLTARQKKREINAIVQELNKKIKKLQAENESLKDTCKSVNDSLSIDNKTAEANCDSTSNVAITVSAPESKEDPPFRKYPIEEVTCARCKRVFKSPAGLKSHNLKSKSCEIVSKSSQLIGAMKIETGLVFTGKTAKSGIMGYFAGLKLAKGTVVHCRYRNGKTAKFPDHYAAKVVKNNADGSIDVRFVDGGVLQRRVRRNDVKEFRIKLTRFNLRAGDLRLGDQLSAPYLYYGKPVDGWDSSDRKVVATLVELPETFDEGDIIISYAHTGNQKHHEYININQVEFAPRVLEKNFIG